MIDGPEDDQAKIRPDAGLAPRQERHAAGHDPGDATLRFHPCRRCGRCDLCLVDGRSRLHARQDVPIDAGIAVPLADFIERAMMRSGFDQPRHRSLPLRTGEPPEIVADTLVLRALGWRPRVILEDGIDELIAYARRRRTRTW